LEKDKDFRTAAEKVKVKGKAKVKDCTTVVAEGMGENVQILSMTTTMAFATVAKPLKNSRLAII